MPLEAVAVFKCLDSDGEPALVVRHSDGVAAWDAIGMLQIALDVNRDRASEMFEGDGNEE